MGGNKSLIRYWQTLYALEREIGALAEQHYLHRSGRHRSWVDPVGECETGQDAGVWGGLSEEERRALKRRNKARARNRARLSA